MAKVKHKTIWNVNELPDFIKRIKREAGRFVAVGINSNEAKNAKEVKNDGVESSSLTLKVIDIATFHEFGAPSIGLPERSFIRSNDLKNKSKYKKIKQEILNKFLNKQITIQDGLGLLGLKVAADIKEGITQGIEPALKPQTIARKGSSTPLIDTGQLRASITHKVDKK